MIRLDSAEGTQLAVAEGNTIHLLTHEGKEIRTLKTDGKIRVLRWWDEHNLLLAGCVDEKVIAFDGSGRRKWVFTSEMDPAVYEAAKTYWFKSAPGHEGIHGLYTGTFDEGKSRCFVGSACTLEILDETGNLVKRTPVFWGPGREFLLVDGSQGTRNLLVSRWPNGNDNLAIVSSRTMAVTGRGYDGVPAGHSYVGGWTAQNRTGLFHRRPRWRRQEGSGDGDQRDLESSDGLLGGRYTSVQRPVRARAQQCPARSHAGHGHRRPGRRRQEGDRRWPLGRPGRRPDRRMSEGMVDPPAVCRPFPFAASIRQAGSYRGSWLVATMAP